MRVYITISFRNIRRREFVQLLFRKKKIEIILKLIEEESDELWEKSVLVNVRNL